MGKDLKALKLLASIIIIIVLIVLSASIMQKQNNVINVEELINSGENTSTVIEPVSDEEAKGILKSSDDINLHEVDGKKNEYLFTYDGEEYEAKFVVDTWKIIDSYKIMQEDDLAIICQALIDIHPIPSADRTSYRTVKDLVYEWVQHNYAYRILPDSNSLKESAKDVDLDPDDQGKNLAELYESRTGKKLNLKDLYY